ELSAQVHVEALVAEAEERSLSCELDCVLGRHAPRRREAEATRADFAREAFEPVGRSLAIRRCSGQSGGPIGEDNQQRENGERRSEHGLVERARRGERSTQLAGSEPQGSEGREHSEPGEPGSPRTGEKKAGGGEREKDRKSTRLN